MRPQQRRTGVAGRRQDDLARDEELVLAHLVHVHADVDVGDEVAPGEPLQLLTLTEGVDRADEGVEKPYRSIPFVSSVQ